MDNIGIYLIGVLFVVYILSFFKEFFFVSYVIQLKEYRWLKFREYLFSAQGRRSFFGIKSLIRLFFVLVVCVYDFFLSDLYFSQYIALGIIVSWFVFECYNSFYFVRGIITRQVFLPIFTSRYILIFIVSLISWLFLGIGAYLLDGFCIYVLLSYWGVVGFLFFAVFLLKPIEHIMTRKVVDRATQIINDENVHTIAISGSYGKSSVKNFLTIIMQKHFDVVRTEGNINTVKGIAHFIFQHRGLGKNGSEYFVCEMGGDTPGEIAAIGTMLNHKVGILTGLNNQHAALYGGLRGAIKAETEIVEQLVINKGVLYANMDNEYIKKCIFPSEVSVIGYSIVDQNVSAYTEISSNNSGVWSFVFHYKGKKYDFETNVLGEHNILNLTGILACCFDLGISYANLKSSVLHLRSHQKTLSETPIGDSLLIDDRYNINIDGVHAGVKMIDGYDNFEKKIVVINEINELGKESQQTHFDLGSLIARFSVDYVFLTGENFSHYIYDGLIANGFPSDQIVDCYSQGSQSSYRKLSELVVGGSSVVLFLGREQGAMKFFDDLSAGL